MITLLLHALNISLETFLKFTKISIESLTTFQNKSLIIDAQRENYLRQAFKNILFNGGRQLNVTHG